MSSRPSSINVAILTVVLASACTSDSSVVPELCDGTDDIRLVVRFVVPPERLEAGEQVVYDNGSGYLALNGSCEYYIDWGLKWDDIRMGTLDDAQSFAAGLRLGSMPAGGGMYSGGGVSDASTLEILFNDAVVRCGGGCEGSAIPDWLAAARSFIQTNFATVYDESSTVDLPQRIVAVVHEGGRQEPLLQWPAPGLDPSTVAISESAALSLEYGSGVLVTGDDATGLRDLRRMLSNFVNPPTAAFTWIDADEQPPDYRVYIRDAIPWEDDRGLLPWP